jgi:hypothetical protein
MALLCAGRPACGGRTVFSSAMLPVVTTLPDDMHPREIGGVAVCFMLSGSRVKSSDCAARRLPSVYHMARLTGREESLQNSAR